MIISRLVFLRMRNVSDKLIEKTKTHILGSNFFFFEDRTVYDIMWTNIVQSERQQMTIWLMRIACLLPKVTNTHSECVILYAFPQQQSLHEHPSMLRYTYTVCRVMVNLSLTAWSYALLEKLICLEEVQKVPAFFKPVGTLPHSQQPVICPYLEPDNPILILIVAVKYVYLNNDHTWWDFWRYSALSLRVVQFFGDRSSKIGFQ